jgi:Fe2+ or Zn2+ uptake regulation protein
LANSPASRHSSTVCWSTSPLTQNATCLADANASGFQIDQAEVIFWGKCPECLAKSLETKD